MKLLKNNRKICHNCFWIIAIIFCFVFFSVNIIFSEEKETKKSDEPQKKSEGKKKSEKKEVKHKYVPTKKCKLCHIRQYKAWKKTKHAKALDVLKALSAEEIEKDGKKIGLEKATIDDCIRCHTTGYDTGTKKYEFAGITCQNCHGPGADYKKISIMKNKKKAIKNGLNIPDEKFCQRCHNPEENPNYKEFDFEKRKDKVHHIEKKKKSEDW